MAPGCGRGRRGSARHRLRQLDPRRVEQRSGFHPHARASVSGFTHVGSTRALVGLGGGVNGSAFFIFISTGPTSYQYRSTASGQVAVTTSGATFAATATEVLPTGTGTRMLTVSGTVTCGT